MARSVASTCTSLPVQPETFISGWRLCTGGPFNALLPHQAAQKLKGTITSGFGASGVLPPCGHVAKCILKAFRGEAVFS